jgi:hypothetical protein
MSPPIKTSPSVAPGVCHFWLPNGPAKQLKSISIVNSNVDLAALKAKYEADPLVIDQKLREDLAAYQKQISGNFRMEGELQILVGDEKREGVIQKSDKDGNGILSLEELESLNTVLQHQILSLKLILGAKDDPDCSTVPAPTKKEPYLLVNSGPRSPKDAFNKFREYSHEQLTSLFELVFYPLVAWYLLRGGRIALWRRAALLAAPGKSEWLLETGPRNRFLHWLLPSPKTKAEKIMRSIDSSRPENRAKKKAERDARRAERKAERARKHAEAKNVPAQAEATPETAATEPTVHGEDEPTQVRPTSLETPPKPDSPGEGGTGA